MKTQAALALVIVAVGCGGSARGEAEAVVRAWSAALNAGDNAAAAALFADGARVVQGASARRLDTRDEARRWNASLPCSGPIVSVTASVETVRATFLLRHREQGRCDAPGGRATALFRIEDGKIVLWHQLPEEPADEPPASVY